MAPYTPQKYGKKLFARQRKTLRRWLGLYVGRSPLWVNLLIYLLVLLMGGAVSWFVWHSGDSLNQTSQQLIDKELPQLSELSRVRHLVSEYERLLYEYYATESEHLLATELSRTGAQIDQLTVHLLADYASEANANQFSLELSALRQLPGQLKQALTPGDKDWDQARAILATASKRGEAAQAALAGLEQVIRAKFSTSLTQSKDKLSLITTWVLVFAFTILVMALFFGSYVSQTLRQNYEKRRLALFIEKSPNPIACFDSHCHCQFTNANWRHACFNEDEIFWQMLKGNVARVVQGKHKFMRELLTFNQRQYEFSIQHLPAVAQTMIHAEDVTEREAAKQALVFKATHDELTSLPNQSSLKEDLRAAITAKPQQPLIILMVNMRRLKMISMNHGHHVSDQLLISLSKKLQQDFSSALWPLRHTKIYRYAGANFCLFAPNHSQQPKQALIAQLQNYFDNLIALPVATEFGHFYVDYAAGLCGYPEDGIQVDQLLRHLDAATVNAGKSSSQKMIAFDEHISAREKRRYQLESALRDANLDEELYLLYQPKISLSRGRLTGLEALIRWQSPQLGAVSPVEFIPVAEESGLIIQLGEWVVEQVCRQLSLWQSSHLELPVAVNISPTHLLSAGFLTYLLQRLEAHHLSSDQLEIEMTEEAYAGDEQALLKVLNEMSDAGLSIAIDDFGTGYSSLSYLSQLPVSTLKIDRAFITELDTNKINQEIVSTIISMAHNMRMTVVAEGMETEAEARLLRSLGCNTGQGYWFAKPMTVAQLNEFKPFLDELKNACR